jgi:hypothetical protein
MTQFASLLRVEIVYGTYMGASDVLCSDFPYIGVAGWQGYDCVSMACDPTDVPTQLGDVSFFVPVSTRSAIVNSGI